MARAGIFLFFMSFIFLFPASARAAETQPGDACPTAGLIRDTGGPEQIPGMVLVCNGTVWKMLEERATDGKSLFQVNSDSGACNSDKQGRLRYTSATDTWEYCSGSAWSPFEQAGSACGGPADCPTIGNVCSDGSVYAGCTTPTDTPMFATRCDAGQTWSGSACTGTRITRAWNNGNISGYTNGTTSLTAGEASTTTLIATDSDSVTGGTQPHLAAAYCDALSIHSKTDWYLPSHAELYLMWVQQSPIGTYTLGNFIGDMFWTSTQVNGDNTSAWTLDFTAAAPLLNDRTKDDANYIRCVRRN